MTSPYQKKHLSQVFLKTTVPCKQLSSLLLQKNVEHVLEVGPGKGILTRVLLDQGFKVTSVEKDHRFVEYLQAHFAKDISDQNLTIVNEDILKFDFDTWRSSVSGSQAICGNIPYNISTPLLERVLPQLQHIKIAALLVQLEFAERLVSKSSSKSYGSLSVFAQLRSDVHLDFKVGKELFSPVPKVDSAIVSFHPKTELSSEDILKAVEKITKMAFSQRRKKIRNALSKVLEGVDVSVLNLDLSRRPDTLTPLEYLSLTKILLDLKVL